MKKNFTFLITAILSLTIATAQNVPITFEPGENGADWNWKTFENDDDPAVEIVENPDKSGANTSNTVAKFTTRAAGQPYAGLESLHGAGIGEYKIDATNSIITIMVHKTVLSDVGIKLVTATGWSKGELKVANTKINEWEEIIFDFSTVDHEDMTYDQIVIFPDFQDRDEDRISYFDNITIGDKEINNIKSMNLNLGLGVYPNPATNQLSIKNPKGIDIQKVIITNIQGQQVLNQDFSNESINISTLSAGVYSVELNSANGVQRLPLIIK